MDVKIIRSLPRDVDALCALFDEARETIKTLGIDQWQNGYPSSNVILNDIARGESLSVIADGELCASFALIEKGEPTYDKIYDGNWLMGNLPFCEDPSYLAIHRVAIAVRFRGQGISSTIIEYAKEYALRTGKKSLRIDTHRGNVVMRRMLEKHGFVHCGTIFLENGDERVAYELIVFS
ncbi:MAG: N-acetyltransferase [Ruminococcaceae bacterium]|nr:N-acetyltransferase [Oscillospiraceae bacterium]